MSPVFWTVTELSTVDEDGNYHDDLSAGVDNLLGFDLARYLPGSDPEVVTIDTVTASLWRYRKGYERTGPTVASRVEVSALLEVVPDIPNDTVAITIPADTLTIDETYQLQIVVTDSLGGQWVRTRELRAVT